MGRKYIEYLVSTGLYTCRVCSTHIARIEDIFKRDYKGHTGERAHLFSSLSNIDFGEIEVKHTLNGEIRIQTVYCVECDVRIGWKYVKAPEHMKYKEKKFLVEVNYL